MYNGKTRFSPGGRVVVNRRTGAVGAQLSGVDDPYGRVINAPQSDTLYTLLPQQSETNPRSYGREVPNSPYKPTEYEDMQVIEVTGTRIPWWMWAIGGSLAFTALKIFAKGK